MYNLPTYTTYTVISTYVLHRSYINNWIILYSIVDGSNDYYNIIIIITLLSLPQSKLFRHGPASASQGEAVVGRTHI